MPEVGIVCADAKVADVDGVEAVFDEVAGDDPKVEDALRRILDAFEEVHGLGSLLDVRGTLGDLFEDDSDTEGVQITLNDDPTADHTLGQILHSLSEAVEEHRDSDSFLAQDLRSFVRLLDILAQDYDVALMNPPYGSKNRMPKVVKSYIRENYRYTPEYYLNFIEMCENIVKDSARIGMLIPRTFMTRSRFEEFRRDFIGDQGGFDFLAEFGIGILDNATVRTAGTVVRNASNRTQQGEFIRLHDVETEKKEDRYVKSISGDEIASERIFTVPLSEFREVPGSTLCYSSPKEVRGLHKSDVKIDAETAEIEGKSVCESLLGVMSGNKSRFYRKHWEVSDFEYFKPIASGGAEAWIMPQVRDTISWGNSGKQIKRSPTETRTVNEDKYGEPGLAWTYIKDTGRRFGYYPPGGLFSYKGPLLASKGGISLWKMLAFLNSDLFTAIMLSQTHEREWNPGEIGSAPWASELETDSELEEISKLQYERKYELRMEDPVSPAYAAPAIIPTTYVDSGHYNHPQKVDPEFLPSLDDFGSEPSETITRSARSAFKRQIEINQELEELSRKIDSRIYGSLDISEPAQQQIRQEIFLRTSEDPEDREVPEPESIPEVPDNIETQVKDLVHHFAMEALREKSDGIIPLHDIGNQTNMLDCIIGRFKQAYDEYAEDRLVEVDKVLGAEAAAEEAYPNLRAFVENDLFDYHVDKMENTPIFWKITTDRLIADSTGEGFACFVDYHSLDHSLFDRLANKYIEPRKAELRERRSAANRRRSDESLATSEQAEAAEKYERCASGLNQISVFEEMIQDLGSTDERDFDTEDRQLVENLAPKVATFRKETSKRVETLAELRERNSDEWFQDTFSNNFWNAVDEWREEWIEALGELERACEEYAKPVDESVEAHLADLFDYFNWRLKGSDHYSSTGILFMTYYFEREGGSLLNEDGQPFDNLTENERLLASLATGLDDPSVVDEEYLVAMSDDSESLDDLSPLAEFKALAEEIDDRCQTIDKRIPSDWSERALSEITTEGYQPNHKHGVEINIKPLVEAEIVPETVDNQVI
jgi:hypothetical protein